ncbi:hypothetical protein [Streptomyces lutosisoli]|uniref:Uncharacterized protein n=1 Tax=Streptomyces lutosisoli TaxID=2665721 RepID=A0ABW2VUF7_9ACTN
MADENVADEKNDGKDRADHLHEVIDQLASGPPEYPAGPPADPAPTAPTRPGGESLREAIHRRMQELDTSEDDPTSKEQSAKPDDETS